MLINNEKEQEKLKSIIEIVRTWVPEQRSVLIKDAFIRLQNFDQNRNSNLWAELLDAIYYNSNLGHPTLTDSFTTELCRKFVREGYWWYNKALWGSLG